jgi:hypothetical protein
MDLSKEELPITSFFSRAGNNKKKENLPPTRAAAKRKRDEAAADSRPDKGKKTKSLKDAAGLNRATLKKPTSRASMEKRTNASLSHVIDLTTPSPERKHDIGHSKMPGNGALPSVFPTPPPTDLPIKTSARNNSTIPLSQRNPAGSLPTPGTSNARPTVHFKPSGLNKVAFPGPSTSPLATRKGVPNMRLLSSSPLSGCSIDEVPSARDSNITISTSNTGVVHALFKAAPKRLGNSPVHEGDTTATADDDPFAAPDNEIIIPSSQPFHLSKPPPPSPTARAATTVSASPIFAIPSHPIRAMALPRAADPYFSPTRSIVESSQSQLLHPSVNSPSRLRYLPQVIIASSQSQVLLPTLGSPRRAERLFRPVLEISKHNDIELVGSSQSQSEKELSLSTQIGLFPLPPAVESASRNFHSHDL